MKYKKQILLILAVAVIILELLPFGAVLRFYSPEDGEMIRTYSYFSLTPYGYANFGPLITAVFSCILLALTVISFFVRKNGLNKAITAISASAFLTSLMPLMFGLSHFSAVGGVISALLLAEMCISLKK